MSHLGNIEELRIIVVNKAARHVRSIAWARNITGYMGASVRSQRGSELYV